MTNVKSPYELHQICNLLLIIISMQDLMILPLLSKLLGVISLIFITYNKILLIFYFSAKILKILSKNFFFFSKLCFPFDFVVFVQGSRQGTLTHFVINMCTLILAFHHSQSTWVKVLTKKGFICLLIPRNSSLAKKNSGK